MRDTLTKKYMKLLIQECPKDFKVLFEEPTSSLGLKDAFTHFLCVKFISARNLNISAMPILATNKERRNTIAYCEESYEQGYSAIINDGKLLGFRREKV